MICANDVMAKTAYQECTRRGIIVGRDIAITGYDDWELAKTMNPPLTTVLQNAFDMGYMAMIGAAELCKGKNVIPLKFLQRSGSVNPVAAVISKNVSVKILFQRKRKNGNGYPEVI